MGKNGIITRFCKKKFTISRHPWIGITLLEIVVSALIMAVMFIPITGLLTTSLTATSRNNEETLALSFARSLLTETVDAADFETFRTQLTAAGPGSTVIMTNLRTGVTLASGTRQLCPAPDYFLNGSQSGKSVRGIDYNFEIQATEIPIFLDYLTNPPADISPQRLWYPFPNNPSPPVAFSHTTLIPANFRYIRKIVGSTTIDYESPVNTFLPDIVFIRLVFTVRWTGRDNLPHQLELVSFKGDLNYDL